MTRGLVIPAWSGRYLQALYSLGDPHQSLPPSFAYYSSTRAAPLSQDTAAPVSTGNMALISRNAALLQLTEEGLASSLAAFGGGLFSYLKKRRHRLRRK